MKTVEFGLASRYRVYYFGSISSNIDIESISINMIVGDPTPHTWLDRIVYWILGIGEK